MNVNKWLVAWFLLLAIKCDGVRVREDMCVLYVFGVCVDGVVERVGLRKRKKEVGEKKELIERGRKIIRRCVLAFIPVISSRCKASKAR